MYSYVIGMSLICTRISPVCHSHVLVCHPCVTRMYSYVIRMSLVSGFTMNLITGYLNINHLYSKIDYLREICSKSPIDIFCINETRLDSSYPDAQFEVPGYQYPPYCKDRNKSGGSKIVFVRKGLITKRLKAFEGDIFETICLEVTIPKKV